MSNIRISKYEIFVKDINDSLIDKIGVGRRFEEIGMEIRESILTAIGETKLQEKVENEKIQNNEDKNSDHTDAQATELKENILNFIFIFLFFKDTNLNY